MGPFSARTAGSRLEEAEQPGPDRAPAKPAVLAWQFKLKLVAISFSSSCRAGRAQNGTAMLPPAGSHAAEVRTPVGLHVLRMPGPRARHQNRGLAVARAGLRQAVWDHET